MKKCVFTFIFFACSSVAFSQMFKFGGRAGVSLSNMSLPHISSGQLTISPVGVVKLGFRGGFFARAQLPLNGLFTIPVYIQPEILFSSTFANFRVRNRSVEKVVSETYNRIDIPVMIGLKFELFREVRVELGPIVSILLSQTNRLSEFNITQDFNTAIGYQTGIGIDLVDTIAIDAKYEATLSTYRFTHNASLINNPFGGINMMTSFILSIGYFF